MVNEKGNNSSIAIEDLIAQVTEEIKGGPTHQSKRDVILMSSVAEGRDDGNTLQSISLNHNEAVNEGEDSVEEDTQTLIDLEPAAGDGEDVKDGRQYRAKRAEAWS